MPTDKRVPGRTREQCLAMFPGFYENPVIREFGQRRLWTISDIEKMPVSMDALLNYGDRRGASVYNPKDMLTLDELVTFMPDATNNAFYLADDGRYAIVDIEPAATQQCRDIMLSMPWHYAEVSMSGKGLHLVIDYPHDLLAAYPNARKSTLKHDSGTYELHLRHWITFTRNVIEPDEKWGTIPIEKALVYLFAQQRPAYVAKAAMGERNLRSDMGETPDYAALIRQLPDWWTNIIVGARANGQNLCVREWDFAVPDLSRRDFRIAAVVASRFLRECVLRNISIPDEEELFRVTYLSCCAIMVRRGIWRPKNDSMRGGATYLENTCAKAAAHVLEDFSVPAEVAGPEPDEREDKGD